MFSGPMFEPARGAQWESVFKKDGAHYNIFAAVPWDDCHASVLRSLFPEGEANEFNFVLFSTSGVHGTYTTIEEIEASLEKYGEHPKWPPSSRYPGEDEVPDDYCFPSLTFLVVQPRIVCLRYGNMKVEKADIPFLKALRDSSWAACRGIGA